MKYLKKFNEEIGNPHYPHNFSKMEEFIEKADKIINYDDSELEQGEEPSNTDILSELGDLCNELSFTSEELQQVINSGRISDPSQFLKIILDQILIDDEEIGNDETNSDEINWDGFLEDLKRDLGSNTDIKSKDFIYLENWLFDKIVNKKVIGDISERPTRFGMYR